MQKIIIVCNDLFGLEVYSLICEINKWYKDRKWEQVYDTVAFLNLRDKPFGEVPSPIPIIGSIKELKQYPDVRFVVGISKPQEKASAVAVLRTQGAMFETVIAPWMLSREEWRTVGEGSIVCGYSTKAGFVIGSFVTIIASMLSGHHVDDYSTVMRFANIAGDVGKNSFVGNHVFLAVGKTIGDDCYIEDGSIVVKNVKSGTRVSGVPARRVQA